MRVTSAVREYVRKAVLAKVAGRIEAANKAKEAAEADRNARVAKAKALCERVCAEAQAKFVKEARKLGLTFVADSYDWASNVTKDGNYAVKAEVGADDFVETMTRDCYAAKHVPCAAREKYYELLDEPKRIKEAATQAADKLLFELELGKVAKKELDEALKDLEVKI